MKEKREARRLRSAARLALHGGERDSGTYPMCAATRMMYHLLLPPAWTNNHPPIHTQTTAFEGLNTVANAANPSAIGKDDSDVSAASQGQYRRAQAVRAVSVLLESVREAVKKWKKEVRVVRSCG